MSTETDKKPPHRPTLYTPELRDRICAELASGRTLRSVCRDEDMPDRQTIYNWLNHNIGRVVEGDRVIEEGFFDHYTRAREVGLDEVADETMDIADDGTNDYVERVKKLKNGDEKREVLFDKEAVLRSKLRVENRWKYLENMAPRKYGKNVKIQSQALDGAGNPTDPPKSGVEAVDDFLSAVLDAVKTGGGKAPE